MTSSTVAEAGGAVDPVWAQRLAALAGLAGAAVTDSPLRCGDEELAAGVLALEVASRQLVAAQARWVAEAARRGLPGRSGTKDGVGWLRAVTNLAPSQAKVRVLVGEALLDPGAPGVEGDPDLLPARRAVLAGALTAEHAEIVIETADRLSPPSVPPGSIEPGVRAEALALLADQGHHVNVYQLRTAARHLLTRLDPDGDARLAREEDQQAAHRGLTLCRMRTGMVHLTGTLTSECGGLLATAIDAGSAPRPAADGTPDDRTAAMRRHDGLQHLVDQVVAAEGFLPSTHGTAYRLVVTVPHDTVQAAAAGDVVVGGRPATLPDGWPLSATTAATLACTAELVPVTVDGAGNPLDVGDAQYLFPPRIRTAIITRDGGCTWPGCTAAPPWCHTHHLNPFASGGPTSVGNGALLCGRHHRHVHSHRYTGEVREGTVHWDVLPRQRGTPMPDGQSVFHRLVDHLVARQQRHVETAGS